MESNNQQKQSGTGTCVACGCVGGMHRHSILRILLALVIVGFIFSAGIRLGELKADLDMGGYGHHMMMRGDYGMNEGQMPMAMPATTTTVVAPATPAAPVAR